MKVRSCFVNVPEYDLYTDCPFPAGRYTMYYYGPSAANKDQTIVEDRKGILTSVPTEWVKLV